MQYRDRIDQMVEQNEKIGDIITADNIYEEYKKGVSVEDLSIKYKESIDKVKEILRKFGENLS